MATKKEDAQRPNEEKVHEDKFRVCYQDKATGSRRWVDKPVETKG